MIHPWGVDRGKNTKKKKNTNVIIKKMKKIQMMINPVEDIDKDEIEDETSFETGRILLARCNLEISSRD